MTDINLLIGLVGITISVASFFIGRVTSAKKSGHEWGAFSAKLNTDIEYIKRDVSDIKTSVSESSRATMVAIQKEEDARKEADRRLHSRLDEHMAQYHRQ